MRAQAQLLTFTDLVGVVQERWQSYWADAVTYAGQQWQPVQFEVPGVVDGDPGSDRGISILMAASSRVVRVVEGALAAGWVAQLQMFEFDAAAGAAAPPASMTLLSQFDGQAVRAKASVTSISLELGTALAPVGATVPPRILSTRLMGVGARL